MKTNQLLLTLLAVLLPLTSWANVWQDPETKVNYEYTVGKSEASVKALSTHSDLHLHCIPRTFLSHPPTL